MEDLPACAPYEETPPPLRGKNRGSGLPISRGDVLIDLVVKDTPLGGEGPIHHQNGNLDHLCLRVEPFDATALQAWLTDLGLPAEAPRRRFGAEGFGASIYSTDPEGNRLEFKGPAHG